MEIQTVIQNYANTLAERNGEWEALLEKGDIDRIKAQMQCRGEQALAALREYDTHTHEITKRQDKIKTDKDGRVREIQKQWKLPIPYPVYINEIALVFMFGQPVKWTQESEGTDDAFQAFTNVVKRTRFDSKLRQCKRIAGSETESAMLFRVYKNDEGKADVQIRVLAKSKGDEIYVRRDNYENILSIGWGYHAREGENVVVYHFDIFTKEATYRCARRKSGWEVMKEPNFIGKIPIILFQQEKEWAGVEHLIHREEYIASRTADTNDYFADPIAVVNSEVIKSMPEKGVVGKLLVMNGKEDINNAAKYLTWDSAPVSKKEEIEWLQNQILSKSFTPNITLDELRGLGNLSGKALRTVMMLADIKAQKNKEIYDEMLDRAGSLIKAIIGNVLNVSLKSQCDALEVSHSFQEPFGEDIADNLDNIIKASDAGIISSETAIALNPMVKDPIKEKERIAGEREERNREKESLFDDIEGAMPGSAE